nr:cytochrome b [uncultured Erwinia sp.]
MNDPYRTGRQWMDAPERYGLVTRILHWGMAYLLLWQLIMALSWKAFSPSETVENIARFGPDHGTVGLLTIALVVVRAVWGFTNRRRRPPRSPGWMGTAAHTAHLILYALMFIIPAIALLRVYGSGEGWSPWGLPLIPETGTEVGWMTVPANALHALLAWVLCGIMAVHILAAFYHRFVLRDATLGRMAGLKSSRGGKE